MNKTKKVNHSMQPDKFPSINHQILDEQIRSGQLNPATYVQGLGTTFIEEVPAYQEWKRGELKLNTGSQIGSEHMTYYMGSVGLQPNYDRSQCARTEKPKCQACGKLIY